MDPSTSNSNHHHQSQSNQHPNERPNEKHESSIPSSSSSTPATSSASKGIVLGPDGKPCKVCTGFKAWTATQMKTRVGLPGPTAGLGTSTAGVQRDESGLRTDCPPDGDRLGRHTWTFLHSTAAHYPASPDAAAQRSARALLDALAVLYPCQPCAGHLQAEIARNPPDVSSREKLERWMCETHNEVNRRLGKQEFDCRLVAQRWRDGWSDGRCDE